MWPEGDGFRHRLPPAGWDLAGSELISNHAHRDWIGRLGGRGLYCRARSPAEPGMIRNTITLSGALALLLSVGCGNKGPLYLPEPDARAQDTAIIEPASDSSVEQAE